MNKIYKILIVEDNELNRDMLSRRLERRGYQILVAEDGISGVEKTFKELPDLILMDINLPGIDGLEAVRRIRENSSTQMTPIIALSAHARIEDQKTSLEAGCNEYECKPVEINRLIQKINNLIKK